MSRFVIAEPEKCIGCRTCEVACVMAHPPGTKNEFPLATENFFPRLKVVKNMTMTAPVQCHHCENAPCVNVCPTKALYYEADTVQLKTELCIGCQSCVMACPFGAMEMVSYPIESQPLGPLSVRGCVTVAQKCDLCLNTGHGPACVEVCPTKTLHLVDTSSLQEKAEKNRQKAAFSMPPNALK